MPKGTPVGNCPVCGEPLRGLRVTWVSMTGGRRGPRIVLHEACMTHESVDRLWREHREALLRSKAAAVRGSS